MTHPTPTKIQFPPLSAANRSRPLAYGGTLEPEWLLAAYRQGIFPWFNEGEPVLWWSPDPRCVIRPERFRVSRRLLRRMRRGDLGFSLDRAFEAVMAGCAAPRAGQSGTWIGGEMREAYGRLHRMDLAHSAEVWQGEELAGGVYGVALGGVFFAESMFHRRTDASKIALAGLIVQLQAWGFVWLDCQMETQHLRSLGAESVPRARFLAQLRAGLSRPGRQGCWRDTDCPADSAEIARALSR